MPWTTPTLREIRADNRDYVLANLSGADALPPNSRVRVIADANAALAHGVHLHIEWQSRQFLPDTAEGEFLDRHADIWIGGRIPATFASGAVSLAGLEGTIVPAGTELSGPVGLTFETTEQTLIGNGPTPVLARALAPGAASNLTSGTSIALVSAISGVEGSGSILTMSGGVDVESDDSLRDRVLSRIRKPPMGGDADDYVAWAREAPGVTRAWCSPGEMGVGTVTVRVMMDDLRSDLGGFPLPADLAEVKAHIDPLRPVAVRDFYVAAPAPEPIDFGVASLIPNTPSTRAAIRANVSAMLAERAAPAHTEGGIRVEAQTIHREWVSAAVLGAAGVISFNLIMDDHPMPYSGSMAVLGTVTFD